jgi:hypothetical protein
MEASFWTPTHSPQGVFGSTPRASALPAMVESPRQRPESCYVLPTVSVGRRRYDPFEQNGGRDFQRIGEPNQGRDAGIA